MALYSFRFHHAFSTFQKTTRQRQRTFKPQEELWNLIPAEVFQREDQ